MPLYNYEAMDPSGMEIKDQVEAPSPKEAMNTIRQMGYFVTKISPAKTKTETHKRAKRWNIIWLWTMLIALAIFLVDTILSLPIGSSLMLIVVVGRPAWFLRFVRKLYRKG